MESISTGNVKKSIREANQDQSELCLPALSGGHRVLATDHDHGLRQVCTCNEGKSSVYPSQLDGSNR